MHVLIRNAFPASTWFDILTQLSMNDASHPDEGHVRHMYGQVPAMTEHDNMKIAYSHGYNSMRREEGPKIRRLSCIPLTE